MWQTCALLIALAAAGGPAAPAAPLPGEPSGAFRCRTAHVPEGRACADRCEQELGGAGQDDAVWECRLSCSRRTLHAIADCRVAPPKPASTPLASR